MVAKLKKDKEDLEAKAGIKDNDYKNKTATKESLKISASILFTETFGLLEEYYKDIEDTEKANMAHFSYTDVHSLSEAEFQPFIASKIKDFFTPELMQKTDFQDYEITQEKLDNINNEALAFQAKLTDNLLDADSAQLANTSIETIISNIHKHINSTDNRIVYFKVTNPEFVEAYKKSAEIELRGTHHTGVSGIVYKNGVPLPNATVRIVGTNKVMVTDSEGHYIIVRVKSATFQILACTEGGDSQEQTFTFRRGHILTLDFHL